MVGKQLDLELVESWEKVRDNPRDFIAKLCAIEDTRNRRRRVGKFLPEQVPWIDALCDLARPNKLYVKPRQAGGSTAANLFLFWKLFTSGRARRAMQMVHEVSAVKRFARIVRIAHAELPRELYERLHVDNQDSTEFRHNRAAFDRILAGGTGQGRSWTATDAHASEMGRWRSATAANAGEEGLSADEEVFNSVLNTIHDPSASIIVESTGGGPRGLFYKLAQRAQTDPKWHFVFTSWLDVGRYRDDHLTDAQALELERELDADERELVQKFGATLGQIAWRRTKMRTLEMTPLMFQREFPTVPRDPFMLSERGWFDLRVLDAMTQYIADKSIAADGELRVFRPFEANRRYMMGVDCAGGVGEDEAVIQVFRDDLVHVACWASRWAPTPEQARMVGRIGGMFGRPLAIIESNNHGQEVIPRVPPGSVQFVLDDDGEHWWTDKQSKLRLMTHAREIIDEEWVVFRDYETVRQSQQVVEKPNGKIEGKEGEHDDRCVAACLALMAGRRIWRRDILAVESEQDRIRRILRMFPGGARGNRP